MTSNIPASQSCSQASTQEMKCTEEFLSQSMDEDEHIWGRLFSLHSKLPVYNLKNNTYSFGRGAGFVDHCFTQWHFDEKILLALSKIHFRISREESTTGEFVVVLEDCSSNGTFVNGTLVGQNSRKVLQNNDEISVAQRQRKVFVFYDCYNNDAGQFPIQLTSNYTVSRKLGDGSFGEVRLAYRQGTLERVAVKIMKKNILSANGKTVRFNNIAQIENEVKLLKSINHPCIIQLVDLVESEDKIFIIMELAEGGELFDRISINTRLKEPVAKLYFYQLLNALAYLHENKITHRDIKPENILLENENELTVVKLTDFGLSKLAEDASTMTTFCGTSTYIAPELLNPTSKGYTSKVDLWSIGVVLYVSLIGHLPFIEKDHIAHRLNILNGRYNFNHPSWKDVSSDAKDVIKKLLVVDPNQRMSAKETLAHKWFKDENMKVTMKNLSTTKRNNKRVASEISEFISNAKTPKLSNLLNTFDTFCNI